MKMTTIKLSAPAKVNLFLAITGLLPDGYHALETVFQAISLADTVELAPRPTGLELISDSLAVPTGPENLCWRAAELLARTTGTTQGVTLHLQKQIPLGAGLGGGSSDAAAVLLGLNQLWGLGLTSAELEQVGAKLGADVAFFIRGGTALGRGKGEALLALPTPTLSLVVAWPAVGLSTPAVYQAWDRLPTTGATQLAALLAALEADDPAQLSGCLRNDLEPAALGLCAACGMLKEHLLSLGCLGAQVTGSGSAVFGIVASAAQAAAVAAQLTQQGFQARAVRALRAGEAL